MNMFWGLGQAGKFSDGSCFICPYRAVVVKIILYSTDFVNDIVFSLVKSSGHNFPFDDKEKREYGVYLTKTKNELYKVFEPKALLCEVGDQLIVKSIEKTGDPKRELYQAQIMLRYLI